MTEAPHGNDPATEQAWTALGGPTGMTGAVAYRPASGVLPARLPVRELARATVGVCSLAAAELLALRNGTPRPPVRISEAAVATAFVSERRLRVDGREPVAFAPLSGFWRAADGWVRTHANYPHHRARLLRALGVPDPGDGDDRALAAPLAEALAARPAAETEEAAHAAGALAVAVAAEPAAAPVHPLVTRDAVPGGAAPLPPGPLPADGVRVLDLTRVIAGPVATRTLALLGADVLRVDSPALPEAEDSHADTGLGKRSTLLDLAAAADRRTFDELLADADVLITGYRPGALDRHGLAPDAVLARHPGLVLAQLNAWGRTGPRADRRGFDSLVQAASGIAAAEAGPDGRPGVLPAQALDHGTGYLLAAAVLRALAHRHHTGEGHHLRLSLAGTADWLLHRVPAGPRAPAAGDPAPGDASAGDPAAGEPYDPEPWLTTTPSPYGTLRHARPAVHYAGGPTAWAAPPVRWGSSPPRWR